MNYELQQLKIKLQKQNQTINDLKEELKRAYHSAEESYRIYTLQLNPKDIVVIRHPGRLTKETRTRIQHEFNEVTSKNGFKNECIVLCEGMQLDVLKHRDGIATPVIIDLCKGMELDVLKQQDSIDTPVIIDTPSTR